MTSEEFWDDDPELFWAFWDAYEDKRKEEAKDANERAYNLGKYFVLAIQEAIQFGKTHKKIYPKKPFTLKFEDDVQFSQEHYEEVRKIQMQQLEERFNSSKK